MKKIFAFAILSFTFFNNFAFSVEKIKSEEIVSTSQTSNDEKNLEDNKTEPNFAAMSTGNKLRIGTSGIIDLLSSGCLLIGFPTAVLSGMLLYKGITLPVVDPFIEIVIPAAVGAGGLALTGIGLGLDYLSEKIMPSGKKSTELVVETENAEDSIKTNDDKKLSSLNQEMLSNNL